MNIAESTILEDLIEKHAVVESVLADHGVDLDDDGLPEMTLGELCDAYEIEADELLEAIEEAIADEDDDELI